MMAANHNEVNRLLKSKTNESVKLTVLNQYEHWNNYQ